MGSITEDSKLLDRCKKVGVKEISQRIGMHPKSLYAKLEGYVNWMPDEKGTVERMVAKLESKCAKK